MTNSAQTPPQTQQVKKNQNYNIAKSRPLADYLSNSNPKKLLISLLFILATVFIWQWVSSPMIVTVQGLGEVSVPATSATITLTVTANAGTSSVSIDSVKAKAENIRTLLIATGISESDISESQVISYPAGLVTPGLEGFESVVQMTAKTDNVAGAAELVGNLYNAGATVVSQPVLNVENQEKLEDQATKEALKEAKSQIAKVGRRNLKFIRKMVALSEQTSNTTSTTSIRPDFFSQDFSEEAAAKGTFKIAKLVTVSYKLW